MITFILKDPSAKKSTLIYLTYYFNGRRLKISTGEKILPSHWNKVKHRPRANAPLSEQLTIFLDRMEARTKEVHLTMKAQQKTINPHSLAVAITTDPTSYTLESFFQHFMDNAKYHKNGSYHSALRLLSKFSGPREFEDIDSRWYENYQAFLEKSNYKAGYIAKNISIIQEVLAEAKRQGIITHIEKGYRKPSEDSEAIYLSVDELLKIYGIELPGNLDRVRNRFIIGAFSGLRFSDSSKITHESIRQGLIFDKNIKTGTRVVIPTHWSIEQIMADHPGGLPPSISSQKTNKYLKEIGKRAGIDDAIIINKTIGGKVVAQRHKKYELITTHTARRSAITNLVLAGIPTQTIMLISGHKEHKSFQKYVKISKETNAMSIKDHPFFQNL